MSDKDVLQFLRTFFYFLKALFAEISSAFYHEAPLIFHPFPYYDCAR